ncbi:MAG: hypothetical protein R6U56_05285 [Opitutales bacterium]
MSEDFDISAPLGPSARGTRWLRTGAILALGLLAVGLYLLIFRPVTGEVAALEADLERTHRRIAETGFGYPENPGEYLEDAGSKLERMRQLAEVLFERATFHSEMEEMLTSPFRVLEFEQRRFNIQQRLTEMAEERGSSLPVDLFSGLPSYRTTTERQQLLWLHLEFFNHVMEAVLSSGTELQVERVESLPVRTLGETSEAEGSLFQVQLRVKVSGPASSLAAFLNGSLPGEATSENSMAKKAYSIDRLDLQRLTDNGGGQVILDTRLSGFILSNQAF